MFHTKWRIFLHLKKPTHSICVRAKQCIPFLVLFEKYLYIPPCILTTVYKHYIILINYIHVRFGFTISPDHFQIIRYFIDAINNPFQETRYDVVGIEEDKRMEVGDSGGDAW